MTVIDWTRKQTATQRAAVALDAARTAAESEIVGWIEAFCTEVTGHVPAAEVASWAGKEEAARLVLAGPSPDAWAYSRAVAVLDLEAGLTGESRGDLATRIIDRAVAYRGIMARLTGVRRRLGDALKAASTPDEVTVALAAARTACDAVAEAVRRAGS